MFTTYDHIKKPKKITDFFMILAWAIYHDFSLGPYIMIWEMLTFNAFDDFSLGESF